MNRTLRLLFVCLLQAVWAVASAYDLKVEATPHGACSLNTSGGDYDEGSRVYLRTYGNTGYVFKGWYKGDEVISSSASFYYTMPAENVVLQARYEYDPSVPADPAIPDTTKRYKLSLGITPNGAGSLNTSGGTYAAGTNVSLRAYVNTGYHFTGWTDEEGNTLSTSTSYSYTMPGRNVQLTANYYYDPSVPANPDSMATNYTVQVKCKPVGGGSFNTSSVTSEEGSTVHLYSYTNTGYRFLRWEDANGKELSAAQNFYYTIPHGNSVVYGVFEYDPPVPSNPGKNYWNKELGEVIVDDFSAGSLGNAVSTVIGNSSRDDVAMITVAGKMNDNDFGIANNYTNCTLLDLSRVTGITTVPSYAFDYTNLESVYLPASVETIGYRAFYECKQLSSLTVYAMVPPAVGNYAFSGIPEGLVVYVPASSISQYEEAEGWKNFTFLPIQEDIRNVTISLPEGTDASVYAQMWLELTNRKSGQRMHFVMTDRSSYTFANIIRNTSWNAVVRNQRGDVFGKIDAIDVADEDVTVAFESLQLPQNVTLTVKDAEGKDVTADTQITWTDAAGNYLAQSYSVNGLLPGNKLGYNIVLSQNLAMAYAAPSLTEYTVADSDNNIVCTLTPLQKVVVSGKVIDLTTKSAISGAVVSASQTFGGKYSKTTNVKTDSKGQYSIEVFRVPTSLAIAASDYVSQTMGCDVIDAEGENVSVADVSLKSITGAVISLGFTYTKCPDNEGEEGTVESFYSDYNNVDYAIFNKTQNRSISQFNVQYPNLVLLEEVSENDVLELTVSSRTSAFVPVKATAMIDAEQRASATFDIVGLGKLKSSFAVNGNASVVGSLYDAKGKLIKTYDYSGGKLIVSDLADGNYTLVTMGSSRLFNTIYDLSQLPQAGLTKDVDYVQNNVKVESGKLSVISIAEVPTLDESKLYYTGDNTSFTVNKSSIVAGNYLTLTGHLDFKSAYSTKVSNVNLIVDLPESCSFVENSVMVGNTTSSYTFEGNRVIIPMARYTDRVRFCIIPTLGGDYAPSALVQFDIDGETITQPIGSAHYMAEDLSIKVPSTVATTTIPVSGTAIGASDIEIYDNDVMVGQTRSLANGLWSTTVELNNPYNLSVHKIYAKVRTKSELELLSKNMECTYDMNAIQISKVTMYHWNPEMRVTYESVFDFQNPSTKPNQWTVYYPKKIFTYTVDFTVNDPERISNVVLYVHAANGQIVPLTPEFNKEKGLWIANLDMGNRNDGYYPVNVSVDFDYNSEIITSRGALYDESIDANSLNAINSERSKEVESILSQISELDIDDSLRINLWDSLFNALAIDNADVLVPSNNTEELFEFANKLLVEIDDFEQANSDMYWKDIDNLASEFSIDLSEFGSEGNVSILSCENLCLETLVENGYEPYLLDDGTQIYLKTSETETSIVDLTKGQQILLSLPVSSRSFARAEESGFSRFWNAITLLRNTISTFANGCGDIQKQFNKYIANLEHQLLTCQKTADVLWLEARNCPFDDLKIKWQATSIRLDERSRRLAQQIDNARKASLVVARIASKALSIFAIVNDAVTVYNDLVNLSKLVSDVPLCLNFPEKSQAIINRINGLVAGKIANATANILCDVAAINAAWVSVAAAPATGGTSLTVTLATFTATLAKAAIGIAIDFAFRRMEENIRKDIAKLSNDSSCTKCGGPNTPPCPDPNPGGGNGDGGNGDGGNGDGGNGGGGNGGGSNGSGSPNDNVRIDPSGYVYEGVFSNRLEGVTATCYYKETVEDMYGDKHENIVKWDAAEYAQENPLFTDQNGYYRWDVPQGLWQVKFEKEGYETTYSEWLPVPPPQLDINIAMKQNVQPTVKAARAFEDAVEMEFDKYMMPELLTTDNIRVMAGDNAIEGTVELLNEEVSYEGNEEKFASKVRFNAAAPFDATEITLMVSNRVKSYAGIRMQDDYSQSFTVETEMRSVVCDSVASVDYNDEATLTVQVLPAVASAGKTVKVKSSSTMILSTDAEELTLDAEGRATLTVCGELPGAAAVTYTVDGYDLTATTIVNVEAVQLVPDMPMASVASGSAVLKGTLVTLTCPTAGAVIYYTTDGSCPCETATAKKYDGTPIVVDKAMTIKAMAIGKKGDESDIASYTYSIRETDMQIALVKGWNWTSHSQADPLTTEQLVEMDNVDRMLTQTGELYRDAQIGYSGHMDDVKATETLKVHATETGSIVLRGALFNPGVSALSLRKGWNWIGYPVDKALAVSDAFSKLQAQEGDFVTSLANGFAQYDGTGWTGTLETMLPGQGYLFKSASDKELYYSTVATKKVSSVDNLREEVPLLPWTVDVHAYPSLMCVTANVYEDNDPAEVGRYVIGAFVGNQCRGVGRYVDGRLFLAVHGGDKLAEKVRFVALDTKGGQLYDIVEQMDFSADAVGMVSEPWRMTLGNATGVTETELQAERFTIYHINGTLITNDGNRRMVERLPSGVYVINGVKYVVE